MEIIISVIFSVKYLILTLRLNLSFNHLGESYFVIFNNLAYNLCLTNSYRNIPQATETFKDSIFPNIGNFAL